jgi:hypothetical protein
LVGAPGVDAGVTALEGADAGPSPLTLWATTVKVYSVPLVRPVIVTAAAAGLPLTVPVAPPGDAVAVYEVIVAPLLAGAVQVKLACWLPAAATTAVGCPGIVEGVTELEAPERGLLPAAFVAETVKV